MGYLYSDDGRGYTPAYAALRTEVGRLRSEIAHVRSPFSADAVLASTLGAKGFQVGDTGITDLAAGKVTGQLADAQLAAIAANKVTGTLVDAQLAGMNSNKLTGAVVGAGTTNVQLTGATDLASGTGVIAVANAGTTPSGTPAGGGVLYVTGGALHFKGSSGTDTTVAPA